MATTPTYGWPYQGLSELPNGAILGENLALAIEATMQAREAEITATEVDIAALEALSPYRARQTLSGTAASVTFSSIPSTLRSLRVLWTARGDDASTLIEVRLRVNGDSGAQYAAEYVSAQGAVVAAVALSAQTFAFAGHSAGNSAVADLFGSGEVVFAGWDSPHSKYLGYTFASHSMSAGNLFEPGGGIYVNPSANPYTSLTMLPNAGNFMAGSDFQIIGERA